MRDFRSQTQVEQGINGRHVAEINGRRWNYQPGDKQCSPCYTRVQREGAPWPEEAHARTPHPESSRLRIYWIFLAIVLFVVLLFACVLV